MHRNSFICKLNGNIHKIYIEKSNHEYKNKNYYSFENNVKQNNFNSIYISRKNK